MTRTRPRTSLLEWTITDPEVLMPGDLPEYPDLEKMIEFVVRVVFLGEEYEMVCAGFKYDRHFIWDTGHQRVVSVAHVLRWRYKHGGRRPLPDEMKGFMSKDGKREAT